MTEQMSPKVDATGAEPRVAPAQATVETLLFVDDERNILSALRRLFRPLGYNILLASSGREGLELLKQQPVDLIISDMRMPEMDGAQFLEEAAKLYPDTVRILLTGFSDLTSTIEAINKGKIYRYLSKPWEDTEITLAVKQALQTQRLEREKLRLTELTERQNAQLKDLNENLEQKVRARTQELRQTAEMLERANKELNDSYQNTILVFSSLLSTRESLSGRYAQKVADLARQIAKEVVGSSQQRRDIYFAGLLHELGKLSLPDYVLDRPVYALERKAKEKYRRHPIIGQSALMAVEALQGAANLIHDHEEYFDGSGFPRGLKAEEIPLGARILSIAKDYYGYMTGKLMSNSLSPKAALERIQSQSGKKYDAELVEVTARLLGVQADDKLRARERKLGAEELKAGMKLSRNLYNQGDMLLLARGRVLSELHIRKLAQLQAAEEYPFEVYVFEGEAS